MMNLVLLILLPLWTTAIGADCKYWPNPAGSQVLVACHDDDEMRLSIRTAEGRTIPIDDVSDNLAREGVPTGPAAWSPARELVALEIGLDEEPGVLLIDVAKRSAIFVDKPLVPANVAAAEPQWDRSGRFLIFRTSGTGEWKNEGLYAYDTDEAALYLLASMLPRDLVVASDRLFVTTAEPSDPTKQRLSVYSLSQLLQERKRVSTCSGPP